MSIPTLGKLERVDLRSAWSNEASSFTPWLAQEENLQQLGRVIGMELELDGVEKNVGPFRADILCRAVDADDHFVLIENQLEQTDHKHLGQVLTYVAGLEANSVIWIAQRFQEEHRAAIDWLNSHTVGGVNFFAIEIEVWKIGSSEMAPKFNLVSHPNDWARTVASASKQSPSATAYDEFRFRFWARLWEYMQANPGVVQARQPTQSTRQSMGFALGRSGFRMVTLLNVRDGYVWTAVVMRGDQRWDRYESLLEHRDQIEAALGFGMEWPDADEGIESGKDVWITVSHKCDISDEANWDGAVKWLRDTMESIRKAFEPQIKALP